VHCSVLQCAVAVCCIVFHDVELTDAAMQCVAVCCGVLQCVAVCCSALWCIAVSCGVYSV